MRCHIDFDRLSFVPSVVRQGDFFCSEISEKLIKPLRIKILLLYLHCKQNHIQL